MPGLKQEVDALYNALFNSPAVQITRQPTGVIGSALTGAGAAVGAYDYAAAGANQVQLIAAGANVAGLWICGGGLENMNLVVDETYVLWIGRGTIAAAVLACEIQFLAKQDTAVGKNAFQTVMLSYPLFVVLNVGVALDLANSTAANATANGHAMIMTGLGA